jgi:hypothetical protein
MASSIKRAKKKMMKYHWPKDILFFQNLMVFKPKEIRIVIEKIHEEIRHFGELWTLVEVKKHFFWHDIIESVRAFVKACDKICQLAKQFDNMKSRIDKMKSIPIYDFFYYVTFNIIGPLPKTTDGNKYVLVAIDHYSKWCET